MGDVGNMLHASLLAVVVIEDSCHGDVVLNPKLQKHSCATRQHCSLWKLSILSHVLLQRQPEDVAPGSAM